uniref:Uncharacterized protein n=1 Tax=Anguilla anguilla TaxID=7936 RepID=A0A0E9TU07_ANGAN
MSLKVTCFTNQFYEQKCKSFSCCSVFLETAVYNCHSQ